jgi:hypothetical protein
MSPKFAFNFYDVGARRVKNCHHSISMQGLPEPTGHRLNLVSTLPLVYLFKHFLFIVPPDQLRERKVTSLWKSERTCRG